jgi:NAD(P)H dehydrogenase (quinone)
MSPSRHVLLVTCHPEPRSLNGALRDHARATLERLGHTVEESDLYAMRWKAAVDHEDFPAEPADARLQPGAASRRATLGGTLTDDVQAEQAKLLRADAIVFQFPLWWFAMPALLKGWFDRVFSNGFGYGILPPEGAPARYSLRYGEGRLVGKRALICVTTGGQETHFSDRGVNGPLEHLLFPLTHGTLWYAGMDVLPLHGVYATNRLREEDFAAVRDAWTARLEGLFSDTPIAWRAQNGGDYDADLRLREDLGKGTSGFDLHRRAGSLLIGSLLAGALLGTTPTPARADAASSARALAANCTSCHGSEGRSVGEVPPSLAGRDRGQLLQQLLDFRADRKPSTIMGQYARGYSEAQLALIAGWFANLSPGAAQAAPVARLAESTR